MPPELDLLGIQIMAAIQFRSSGFEPTTILYDDVTNENVPANEMFTDDGGRWFMRAESIPGHLGVKAIAVDKEGVYLETSPIDGQAMKEALLERMWPVRYADDQNSFVDITTGKELISIGPVTQPEVKELGARRLWTLRLTDLNDVRIMAAVKVMDVSYTISAYEVEEIDEPIGSVTTAAGVQKLQQKLNLVFQQRMQMEQRPMLSLSTRQQLDVRPEQNMELRQLLALNFRLARMGSEELEGFLLSYAEKHGVKAAENAVVFTLAGKLKKGFAAKGRGDITWREVRKYARKLLRIRVA